MQTKDRKPVNRCVVVEEIKEERKTASGILLMEKETRGRIRKGIVYLADKNVKEEAGIQEGCTVYFRPGAGQDISLDDKNYLILRADSELVLVEND